MAEAEDDQYNNAATLKRVRLIVGGVAAALVLGAVVFVVATAVSPAQIRDIGPTADANTFDHVTSTVSANSWNGSFAVLEGDTTFRWRGVGGPLRIKARTSTPACDATLVVTTATTPNEHDITSDWQTVTSGDIADTQLVKLDAGKCPIDLEWVTTRNPWVNQTNIALWDDPNAPIDTAARTANNPAVISAAVTPAGIWLSDPATAARRAHTVVRTANAAGKVPLLVLYAVPDRDCEALESAGGASDAASYQQTVAGVATAISGAQSLMIVEPDALSLECGDTERRIELVTQAAATLAASGSRVYIDAGHPNWRSVDDMATLLVRTGAANVAGFAVNVSNFANAVDAQAYGDELVERLAELGVNNASYIVDISRSGAPVPGGVFCNPPEARLGTSPALGGASPYADALLWVKPPGESDGACGIDGAPAAGEFWLDGLLALIHNS